MGEEWRVSVKVSVKGSVRERIRGAFMHAYARFVYLLVAVIKSRRIDFTASRPGHEHPSIKCTQPRLSPLLLGGGIEDVLVGSEEDQRRL